jgi:hypothetical protein
MKRIPLILFSIVLAIVLTLSGCTKTEYVTVTDTTTLPAVTVTQTATTTITTTSERSYSYKLNRCAGFLYNRCCSIERIA